MSAFWSLSYHHFATLLVINSLLLLKKKQTFVILTRLVFITPFVASASLDPAHNAFVKSPDILSEVSNVTIIPPSGSVNQRIWDVRWWDIPFQTNGQSFSWTSEAVIAVRRLPLSVRCVAVPPGGMRGLGTQCRNKLSALTPHLYQRILSVT